MVTTSLTQIVIALNAVLAIGLVGQALPPSRPVASVQSLPTFSADAASAAQTELTVRWVVAQAPPGTLSASRALPGDNRFEISKRVAVTDAPVRERDPQVGADELVIVALDAQGREVGWQHLKDPRIVRSEQPGPGGLLRGQILYRGETELVVQVPDSLAVVTLNVYELFWSGSEFVLRACGSISLR